MSRYIDADALIEELQSCSYDTWSKDINRTWWAQAVKVKDNIVKCIERQTTADVVEVVRCKDCAWYNIFNECCTNTRGIFLCKPDGYCNYGERREG